MSSDVAIRGVSVVVSANGLQQRVLRYGAADAPDLLFLPGITSPAVTADFLAVLLADLGFRVTVPDARGRGLSDRAPAGAYRVTDYAADVAGLVTALDLHDPIVIGHSMGARTAAAWAVRYSTGHRHLILVDPPMSGPGRAPYPTSLDAFREQLGEAYRGTTADEVRRFYPRWPQRELQLRADVLASCDETAVVESHRGFETEDFMPSWREVNAPVLLVHGQDSPVVPTPAAENLRQARPDIEIVAVPDAGHMVPWDNLPGFLAAVTPHLRPLARAT